MPHQQPLPQQYGEMTPEELTRSVVKRKEQLAGDLCILGHHYQADQVVRLADFTGDSLKLSQLAASQSARYIVFCGVHFMAESADILTSSDQAVCLPHMLAGCAMAEMAEDQAVAAALEELAALTDQRIVPVTYVNSTAAIKAVTGRAGGACCTSSNVANVFRWALSAQTDGGAGAGGKKVLAVPDQHLGLNTAIALGYSVGDTAVYDPSLPTGGLTRQDVDRATFILWKGHCYVHQRFTPDHVRSVRRKHEGITVIVHPECPREVVRLADASGSTEQIIQAVAAARPDSQWAIGTESNLVNRLAMRHGDMFIRVLSDAPALCAQMGRIDVAHLLWVLDNLADGHLVNRVTVDDDTANDARVALQRMIDIKAAGALTPHQ